MEEKIIETIILVANGNNITGDVLKLIFISVMRTAEAINDRSFSVEEIEDIYTKVRERIPFNPLEPAYKLVLSEI